MQLRSLTQQEMHDYAPMLDSQIAKAENGTHVLVVIISPEGMYIALWEDTNLYEFAYETGSIMEAEQIALNLTGQETIDDLLAKGFEAV